MKSDLKSGFTMPGETGCEDRVLELAGLWGARRAWMCSGHMAHNNRSFQHTQVRMADGTKADFDLAPMECRIGPPEADLSDKRPPIPLNTHRT